jgi:antitoxin ParD1/3/4
VAASSNGPTPQAEEVGATSRYLFLPAGFFVRTSSWGSLVRSSSDLPRGARKIGEDRNLEQAPMNVTLPDSLKDFVEQQVSEGRYANADAFIEDLVRNEAELFERASRGEPFRLDEHFDRRLEALLDEGEQSGDYRQVTSEDFDAMEREAQELARHRKSP